MLKSTFKQFGSTQDADGVILQAKHVRQEMTVFENSRLCIQTVLRVVSIEGGLWCSVGASKIQELMPSLLAIGF
jgi:hypothetical protein